MLDLFEIYDGTSPRDVEIRRGQISYLNYLGYSVQEIRQYVHLAYNTIVTYIWQYGDSLLEWAKKMFQVTKRKIKAFFKGEDTITWDCPHPQTKVFTYIVEHYDKDGNFVWLKVGQTRVGEKRLLQHLDENSYILKRVEYVKVKKIFEFEDEEDTKVMESFLKQHYKLDPKNEYIPQDRFKSVMFTEEDLLQDKIFQEKIKIFNIGA